MAFKHIGLPFQGKRLHRLKNVAHRQVGRVRRQTGHSVSTATTKKKHGSNRGHELSGVA